MKKLFVYGLSVALIAGGASSCKKSSKNKVSNDWSVTGYESTSSSNTTSSSGNYSSTNKSTLSGTKLTKTGTSTYSGTTTTNDPIVETIQDWTYTINKDGTWSRTKNYTIVTAKDLLNATLQTITYNETVVYKETDSGNWNFVGKNKTEEFKKNERLAFSTLSSEWSTATSNDYSGSTPTVPTVSTGTVNNSGSNTVEVGNDLTVFTITESKKKSLVLTADLNYTYSNTYGGNTNKTTNTGEVTITLEQK